MRIAHFFSENRSLKSLFRFLEHFSLAFIWLLFILFFTYSNSIIQIVQTKTNWVHLYFGVQGRLITVLINFGLLFMLAIDYFHSDKNKYSKLLFISLFSFFIILSIYGHAKYNLNGTINNYMYPICSNCFSYVLEAIFLFVLLLIRYKTIEKVYHFTEIE